MGAVKRYLLEIPAFAILARYPYGATLIYRRLFRLKPQNHTGSSPGCFIRRNLYRIHEVQELLQCFQPPPADPQINRRLSSYRRAQRKKIDVALSETI